MRAFPLPFRFTIPIVLLAFGVLMALISFVQNQNAAHRDIESDAVARASFLGNLLSAIVEYDHNRGETHGADLSVRLAGANPNLNLVLVLDGPSNQVLYSSQLQLRHHPYGDAVTSPLRPAIARATETNSAQVQLSSDRSELLAVFPLRLVKVPGELRPTRPGALILRYDLTDLKKQDAYSAAKQSLLLVGMEALLCLLLWAFFRQTLTKRVARLLEATRNLSRGIFEPSAQLKGSDELAELSRAFSQMALQLEANATELRAANQRMAAEVEERRRAEEAVNHLNQELETRVQDRTHDLEEANQRLKELDRLKDNLLSTISHELRTPLTSLRGYAEFLEDHVGGPLSLEQEGFVAEILAGASRLEHLVDDLLDYAKLEAGTFKLATEEVALDRIAREILSSLRPQAKERGITLDAEVPEDPLTLVLDPKRIGQVLLNLIGNALKFTPSGGRVTLSVAGSSEGARVEVRDTGIGIPPEAQERLFEKFYQVDASSTRSYSGVGLGLSICKALVEAHGGPIGVKSAPSQGSCFWFTLPPHPPEPEN